MAESKYEPRLKAEYVNRIRKAMQEQFSYANEMQIPKLDKIVINMGVGAALQQPKLIEGAVEEAGVAGLGVDDGHRIGRRALGLNRRVACEVHRRCGRSEHLWAPGPDVRGRGERDLPRDGDEFGVPAPVTSGGGHV